MRIAIPKGRLQSNALATFAAAGYDVPSEDDLRTRKLVFSRPSRASRGMDSDIVEWIFVKDCDVPVYVENGAADAGVAGLDQILEHTCGAYQAVELPYGHCRMMLIGAPNAPQLSDRARIATKYPRIARTYLDERAMRAEIVPLGGSVELAAVLGLTTHVIDLVETGETVRVHKLVMQDLVAEITPRLIVAKNFFRTSNKRVRELIARIEDSKNVLAQIPVA